MELNLAHVFGAASISMRAANVNGPAAILIIFMRRPLIIQSESSYPRAGGEPCRNYCTPRTRHVRDVARQHRARPCRVAADHPGITADMVGVIQTIAFGAATRVGHTGSAVCHMLQRVLTIRLIGAKLAPDAYPVRASRGPAADKHAGYSTISSSFARPALAAYRRTRRRTAACY